MMWSLFRHRCKMPVSVTERVLTVIVSQLEALLFDVDGTLADTERDGHRVAFNTAFANAGLDWHWSVELYRELLAIAGGKERIRYYIENYQQHFKTTDLDALIAELHSNKTQLYRQLLAAGRIPFRPGAKRLLRQAHEQGLRLGIVTTTAPENVHALFEHAMDSHAIDWFDVIAAGDVVAHKKPAPDIYHYALKQLDLAAEACLAFEDSHNGLRASLQAGVQTVVLVNDYTYDHDFSGALTVLDHFGEPEKSFTMIVGDMGKSRYLDVELLRRWHASALTRPLHGAR